ncbi:MAG: PIN domain-containing protein, partial [Aureliella sp.]
DKDDYWHSKAVEAWSKVIAQGRSMVTSSVVLIELADGLCKVRFRSVALQLVDALNSSKSVDVVHVSLKLEAEGWDLYRKRTDKDWGMTDCISMIMATERTIVDIFGLDHHFEQAGFNLLIRE